jgi:hypothetical protein
VLLPHTRVPGVEPSAGFTLMLLCSYGLRVSRDKYHPQAPISQVAIPTGSPCGEAADDRPSQRYEWRSGSSAPSNKFQREWAPSTTPATRTPAAVSIRRLVNLTSSQNAKSVAWLCYERSQVRMIDGRVRSGRTNKKRARQDKRK